MNWHPRCPWKRRNIYEISLNYQTNSILPSLKITMNHRNKTPHNCLDCGCSLDIPEKDTPFFLFCDFCKSFHIGENIQSTKTTTAFFTLMRFLLTTSEQIPHRKLVDAMADTGLWSKPTAEVQIKNMIRQSIIFPIHPDEYRLIDGA